MKTHEQAIKELHELTMLMSEEERNEPIFIGGDDENETLYSAASMLKEVENNTELGKKLLENYLAMIDIF